MNCSQRYHAHFRDTELIPGMRKFTTEKTNGRHNYGWNQDFEGASVRDYGSDEGFRNKEDLHLHNQANTSRPMDTGFSQEIRNSSLLRAPHDVVRAI